LSILYYFLRYYFPQKIKNFADRQDVEKLTKIIENIKSQINIQQETQRSFQSKCSESLEELNKIITDITRYCFVQAAKKSGNEYYIYEHTKLSDDNGFHFYRVIIDEYILKYFVYLSEEAKKYLQELSNTLGSYAQMELCLLDFDPLPEVVGSAKEAYLEVLGKAQKCQSSIFISIGLQNKKN
jgi:hypothetical protein